MVIILADYEPQFDIQEMHGRAVEKDPMEFQANGQIDDWFSASMQHITRKENSVNRALHTNDYSVKVKLSYNKQNRESITA